LPPGEKIGPYETLSLIGKGGMDEVYEARDTRSKTMMALSPKSGCG